MRLILRPLSKHELSLVLRILNLDPNPQTNTLADLEEIGAEFSRRAASKKIRGTAWRNGDDFPPPVLKKQWIDAKESWASVIVSQRKQTGWWFKDLPAVGLPSQYPPVIIRDPGDLTYWLLVRAVANRQHLRFVKCARDHCGKFGLRERARVESRFCSPECQVQDNADKANARGSQKKPASDEPFGSVKASA
jgi:hypothetical protein